MCRLSRVWLARTVGVVAVLVTLVAVATVPVILDDVFGWDLMEVRKGPVFIAMVALVAMFTAWSAATSLVDRILGRRVELAIPGTHVRSLTPSEHHVTVVFDDEAGVPTYLSFWADRKSRAAVAQLPRRAEQ